MACVVEKEKVDAGTTSSDKLGSGSTRYYMATVFQASDSTARCGVAIALAKLGTPSFNIYASIWTDSVGDGSGLPSTQVSDESSGMAASSLQTSENDEFFTITNFTPTSGNWYHVVLRADGIGTTSNCVLWYYYNNGSWENISIANSTPTWSNSSTTLAAKFILYANDAVSDISFSISDQVSISDVASGKASAGKGSVSDAISIADSFSGKASDLGVNVIG